MKRLSDKAIQDFKTIYKKVLHEDISDETAKKYATDFMELFIIAITKSRRNEYNNIAVTK